MRADSDFELKDSESVRVDSDIEYGRSESELADSESVRGCSESECVSSKSESAGSLTKKKRSTSHFVYFNPKKGIFALKVKITVLISFSVLTACVSTATKRKEFIIADSKSYEASLYRQNCAVCHGTEANGKEVNGVLTPSLRYGDIEKKSEEEIYTQISHGKLPMPAFKYQLTEKEIRQMAQFIRRDLQGKQEAQR